MTEEAIKIGAYLRTLRLEENDSLEEIAAGITTLLCHGLNAARHSLVPLWF